VRVASLITGKHAHSCDISLDTVTGGDRLCGIEV
jgi:hypothetical protein